jgi:2-polyprenyl-3-methyl-5-hydroxy-6-metoxy-1,4-benzoquinol methylase
MIKMKIITNYPVAYESEDHIFPWGTMRDNTTDLGFISEVENYFFAKKIKTLDIGCAGGQITIDFKSRGHIAIGIEGSDHNVKHQRGNWAKFHNLNLFTCDATKPYIIIDETNNHVIFDLITSWDVVEHINQKDFDCFFGNILNHMNENSIFCCSIAPTTDIVEGHVLHQSVFDKKTWMENILSKYFIVNELPFQNKVRYGDSFHLLLKKKQEL